MSKQQHMSRAQVVLYELEQESEKMGRWCELVLLKTSPCLVRWRKLPSSCHSMSHLVSLKSGSGGTTRKTWKWSLQANSHKEQSHRLYLCTTRSFRALLRAWGLSFGLVLVVVGVLFCFKANREQPNCPFLLKSLVRRQKDPSLEKKDKCRD